MPHNSACLGNLARHRGMHLCISVHFCLFVFKSGTLIELKGQCNHFPAANTEIPPRLGVPWMNVIPTTSLCWSSPVSLEYWALTLSCKIHSL